MYLSLGKLIWRPLVVLFAPLLLAPLPAVVDTQEARCGYVIILMAIYWVTEVVPLPVTALVPVFAFPLLGVLSTSEVCMVYLKSTNMLFLGGLIVAISVEACNLHQRIALFVILHVGQSPRRLMAGFMITTMFLSMWISNTASTAMMVPIVHAILKELYKPTSNDSHVDIRLEDKERLPDERAHNGNPEDPKRHFESDTEALTCLDTEQSKLRDMCFLAVAYAANIGGTGTLTGTNPNLVLKGYLQSDFSDNTGLNFATWMAFNIPGMLLCVFAAWIWLQFLFIGFWCKKGSIQNTTAEKEAAIKDLIQRKYRSLGPVTFHETVVISLFVTLVLLWFFQAPEFIPGWASLFAKFFGSDIKVTGATPAILIVFLMFVIPSKLKTNHGPRGPVAPPACLTWEVVHEKVPWGVILILGGGFAMAQAAKLSGLSFWMGQQLRYFNIMPKEVIVLVVCIIVAMLTEVVSNTATASILLPVLQELALGIGVNPLYLMLPAAICCSYAFMLPVATPPNAIVFAAAKMKTSQMVKAGFVMNMICVCIVNIMINTLGDSMFDVYNVPPWAANATAAAATAASTATQGT
ncbi:Na(+)/citrate cotransporter-like [Oratosquilla oratoria]|uniref:Na(+)/citrate cotransporter-like n=1 Tax=Oratosquilla oratoria TaxID=337810 RepID=UPI003F75940C